MTVSAGRAVLVLAHAGDAAAESLVATLRERARAPVRLLTDVTLACTATFRHVVPAGAGGGVADSVALADGTVLDATVVGAVHTRLLAPAVPRLATAAPVDREYGVSEMHALLLSWLHGLPVPVVNRPSPTGLGGARHDLLTTLALARRAGLPVADVEAVTRDDRAGAIGRHRRRLAPTSLEEDLDHSPPVSGPPLGLPALLTAPLGPGRCRLLVTGEDVVGAGHAGDDEAVAAHGDACRRLAAAAGWQVCEVTLAGQGGRWVCTGAGPLPALRSSAHVTALAAYLERLVA